jgi:vitamin B12 transporter
MNKLARFLVVALFLTTIIPLAAQDAAALGDEYEDDDYFGEWLIMVGEGLTILGSLNTTQQIEIVDSETIGRINAPDLPSLLQEAIGLGVTRYGPYGNMASVNLRGFNTRRIAVLVDGIPVNSSASSDFDFYSISPLSIERIEVIYGGSDTKHNVSGALGGLINIITVKRPQPGWRAAFSFANTSYMPGQYNRQGGGVGGPHWQDLIDSQNMNIFGSYGTEFSSFNFSVFGNRAGNHFLYQDYFGFTRRKEGNEIFDTGISASYLRNVGDYSRVIASGQFYYGDKNIPVSGYSSIYKEQRDLASRGIFMLDMPHAFHDDFAMELSLGYSWRQTNYDQSSSVHDEHSLTLINRWSWFPGTNLTIRFGGDYRFINIDSTNTGFHFGNRGGLYITSEFSPERTVLLIASVKGMTDGSEIIPVPKLGFLWTVNNNLTLKNNYFRSFKFPDFDDLYWEEGGFTGNPDLVSEDGWGADLGAEFSFRDTVFLGSTVYGQRINNSIHWNNASGTWRPENYGSAAFIGWDNRLRWDLPFAPGPFESPTVSFFWIYQLSWLLSGGLSFSDNIRIPYMPMHSLGASLELPWSSGSLTFSGRFESKRYTSTSNIIALDPFFLLNIVYNQNVNENLSFFGRINNVLNTHYFSFADYPMPGLSITLGVNMGFNSFGKRE